MSNKDVIPQNDERFTGFDDFVEKVIKDFKVPGMAVAIVKDDQVIFSRGYGLRNIEENLPVDSETIFAIGSSSKAFTAMGLGILVDQGKLEWEKPVREYLPTFKLHDPFATERMTPRDLVCHRSGLPRHDFLWYNSSLSRKEIFSRLRFLEPNKDFRSYWQYQNLMFLTAGVLIEAVSGLTWEEFSQQQIFDKLEMPRSNFSVEKSKMADNFALPYTEREEVVKLIPFRNIDTVGPAGSINSCVSDMVKWVILHLNGKVGEKEVISMAQLGEMHAPTMVMPPGFMGLDEYKELSSSSYGLGWFVQYYRGHKLVHHGGNIDGFSAMVSFLPDEKTGIALLTNLNGNMATMAVTLNAYDRLLGLNQVNWDERFLKATQKAKEAAEKGKEKTESKKVPNTQPTHDLSAYKGQYEHPGYGEVKIDQKENQLIATYNGIDLKLEHYHYDIFEGVTEEFGEMRLPLYFHVDFQGNIGSVSAPFEASVADIVFKRMPDVAMRDSSFLQQFVGKYEIDEQTVHVVLKGENTLAISIASMPEMELEPYQKTEFTLKGIPMVHIEFILGVDGKVTGLDINQPGASQSAKKVS